MEALRPCNGYFSFPEKALIAINSLPEVPEKALIAINGISPFRWSSSKQVALNDVVHVLHDCLHILALAVFTRNGVVYDQGQFASCH